MNDLEFIKNEGFVVISRKTDENKLSDILTALYEGGVRIIEFTFDPSDENTIQKTTSLIKKASEQMGEKMLIGAGTVIYESYVTAAYEARARFIVSPDFDGAIVKLTKNLGMLSIPGAYTPTECSMAYKCGADIVKLFPATEDKIPYLKNISVPLCHIPFMCTGGTNENNAGDFIRAGAVAVATGASILKSELIKSNDFNAVKKLAALHVSAVKAAKAELDK